MGAAKAAEVERGTGSEENVRDGSTSEKAV